MQFGIYIERFEYFENRGDCQILSVFYTGNLRFFDSDQVAQIFLGQVAFFPNFPNRLSDQNSSMERSYASRCAVPLTPTKVSITSLCVYILFCAIAMPVRQRYGFHICKQISDFICSVFLYMAYKDARIP